ncbi:MAG TPA: hypothetical protein VMR98_02450 [Candidatus Polarisedimenticolaceae bacterium]|nr:hypothetical protein [Candidatus Polarisedimenticolaceae bacterium]
MIQIIVAKADREAIDRSGMGEEFDLRLPNIAVQITELEMIGEAPADLAAVTLVTQVAYALADGIRIFLVVEGSMPGTAETVVNAARKYAYSVVVGLDGPPLRPIPGASFVIPQGGPEGLRLAVATTCQLAIEAGLVS